MRKLLGLAPLLALVACAGTQAARELSRETLAQLTDYEDQVRSMSRSLQKSYRQADADYAEDLPNASQTEAIAIEANLANDAADRTIAEGFTDASLRSFIETYLREQAELEAKYADLRSRQAVARDTALASTRREEKELQAARAKLELLQREPSLFSRAQQLRPLFSAAVGTINDNRRVEQP